MVYRIPYDPERWQQSQQYVLRDLDSDRRLIAHLYLTDGGQVLVSRAWIEQAYVTRRDGWKWRVVEQLRPQAIVLEAQPSDPVSPHHCDPHPACTLVS